MNLKKMYNTVICGMVILLIIIISLLWNLNTLIDRSRTLNQDGIKLIIHSNDMLRVNDYLVKLMRIFAVRNDMAILDEYHALLNYDNLEGKLGKMLEIGLTPDEEAQVNELFILLEQLAEIEARAIDAYHSGNSELTTSIIFSDEYASTDLLLANNTSLLIFSITNRINTSVQDIQGQLQTMKIFMSIFMALSISCLIALQIIQRNRVLKPIIEIESLMNSVASGDAGVRVVKKHNDEIGSLIDHTNEMAGSIESYIEESDNSLNILKSILNGIDASIYVTIPETGEILFINEHMIREFGIENDGIGQLCYKVLQSGIDKRCDFCPCDRLDNAPNDTIIWEECNTITGRTYQNTDCYIDWLGGIKVHLQHSVDITDIKRFADDKLVAEREALEMKHEKEKAEASARAKSDFLAKMSHEIRTPMNAVMGMSEIILRKNLPPDVYENAIGIKSASMNLLSIINDILDFSKIESGMMEIVETNYPFSSLVNDVVSIIRVRLIDKPVQFAVNIAPDIPASLIGDEIRVRQLLINLLSNAVKYTNSGFISLEITGVVSENAVTLTMTVADSGIGVKNEDIGKLFGDFVQIDTIKNRGVEGTGLGLAISRNLCRMMGGDITLKSEYGHGSEFTITLPQRFEVYEPLVAVEELNGKSVLLYETRQVYRDSLVRTFESLGVKHESVESIPEFFDGLENYDYAFISSFMYGSINPALIKLDIPPKIVLLSDITESLVPKDVSVLMMPAYSLSVANMLENIYEDYGMSQTAGASFIAPEAKVLVVDDVVANLKVCEGLLLPYEMQVTICTGAREALELIMSNTYDLVFMDHMMPEMDGLEVTGFIREIEGEYYKNLPIIALTANAVSGVREMFIQNGMNDFLSKPIETAKLDVILDKWIPKEKQQKISIRELHEEESEFVSKLRNIAGLSVNQAISVVGGSPSAYERIVRLSARLLPDNIARLEELIDASLPNYKIEVHGVKGVLNSIGAYELGEKAFELEELSGSGDLDACKVLHPVFIGKLTTFSDIVLALLDGDEPSEKPEGGKSMISDALQPLAEAADFFDNASAMKVLSEIGGYTFGEAIDVIITDLTHAFEQFDFDAALELLDKLKGEL